MIDATLDPMAALEEEIERAQQRQTGGFKPFFFRLADKEKALVRPLLNLDQYVSVGVHEKYNRGTKSYEVSAVCALDYGQPCQWCLEAQKDKKLALQKRFYIAVYVHSVLLWQAETKTWAQVTYKDESDQNVPVKGVRILEMKASSPILHQLKAHYYESDDHDITTVDFVIARQGEGPETNYTVTPKQQRPLPEQVPVQDRERIKSDIELARPMKTVGKSEPSSASADASTKVGSVVNAPDF